ncbi:MAG: T9SS type A sorting domain-containing protein [Flavisolibacter sp.]
MIEARRWMLAFSLGSNPLYSAGVMCALLLKDKQSDSLITPSVNARTDANRIKLFLLQREILYCIRLDPTARAPSFGFLSKLWVGTNNAALPVSKLFFKERSFPNYIYLVWESFNEQNVRRYEIQQSIDGRNFITIGNVQANGNTDVNSYSFRDYSLPQVRVAMIYYRLKVIDIDAAFSFSNVIAIAIDINKSNIVAWPNPVKSDLQLRLSLTHKDMISLNVYDLKGRLLQQQQFQLDKGSHIKTLSLVSLQSGVYISLMCVGHT